MRNLGRRRAPRGDPAWRKTWLGFGRGAERNAPGVGRGAAPGRRLRPESRSARTWEAAPEQDLKGSLGLLAPMWLRGHGAPLGPLRTLGRALLTASSARTSARRGNLLPERIAFFFFLLTEGEAAVRRGQGVWRGPPRARGRAEFEPRPALPEPALPPAEPRPPASRARSPGSPVRRLCCVCRGSARWCCGPGLALPGLWGSVPGGEWPRRPLLRSQALTARPPQAQRPGQSPELGGPGRSRLVCCPTGLQSALTLGNSLSFTTTP